jgi:hypothetical protein
MDKQISEQRPQLYMLLLSEVRNETTRPMTRFTSVTVCTLPFKVARFSRTGAGHLLQVAYDELWCSSTNTGSSWYTISTQP